MRQSEYTIKDAKEALESVGVKSGDTLFVTTSLGLLGKLTEANSGEELNETFCQLLSETVGPEGNILVPAYSYSFGKSRANSPALFDPSQTQAQIGPFPEYFRNKRGVVRSFDPMMSVSGLGKEVQGWFENLPQTSYGEDSLFARLLETDAKCCNIGLGPNWTPFIHHADWKVKVPYRYDKLFFGFIEVNGERKELTWCYSVPLLSEEANANAHRIGRDAERKGIWKSTKLGRARIYLANYREYYEFSIKQLKNNNWALASGPPSDPVELEKRRVAAPVLSPPPAIEDLRECRIFLTENTIAPVSNEIDIFRQVLKAHIGNCKTYEFKTGEHVGGWVVPEKWHCRKVLINDCYGNAIPARPVAYSLSFKGKVNGETLKRHALPEKYNIAKDHWLKRDWWIRESDLPKRLDQDFEINIETNFSLGVMQVHSTRVSAVRGNPENKIIIFSEIVDCLGNLNPSAITNIEIYKHAKQNGNISATFLWGPGTIGWWAWCTKNKIQDLALLLHLKSTEEEELSIVLESNISQYIDSPPSEMHTENIILGNLDKDKSRMFGPLDNPKDKASNIPKYGIIKAPDNQSFENKILQALDLISKSLN